MRLMVLWCFKSMPVQFKEGSESRAQSPTIEGTLFLLKRPRQGVIVAWLSLDGGDLRGTTAITRQRR